ncbi:MAG: ParB/RepB/Spo0J family partition protein [Alphaproteobacteria bacterium]
MSEPKFKRRSLGRGLDALLGEDSAPPDRGRAQRTLPVEQIQPSRVQPRRIFRKEDLESLTQSVRDKGILQPILVRPHPDDPKKFELIAGERRWLAAQAAKLHEVPVVVREMEDSDALEIALIENIQRQDLSPLEEAEAYRRLMDEFKHTQETVARIVGMSRSHVANTLRLLSLPPAVKEMIDQGALTAGHARALLKATDPVALAKEIIAGGLNVRQSERMGKPAAKKQETADADAKPVDTVALEKELALLLGLGVEIKGRGEAGSLIIRYKTLEQLDDVLQRLTRGSR